jgi:hypothetical protein
LSCDGSTQLLEFELLFGAPFGRRVVMD